MKSVYTKKRKKILALLLAAAMLISVISFAEELKVQPAEDAAMDESFIEDEADFKSEPTVEDLPLKKPNPSPLQRNPLTMNPQTNRNRFPMRRWSLPAWKAGLPSKVMRM